MSAGISASAQQGWQTCHTLIISSVALAGCSQGSPDLGRSSERASSAESEVDEKKEDQNNEADKDQGVADKSGESDTEPDNSSESDAETEESDDSEALFQKFIDDKIEAVYVNEDGEEESSFYYSELPHEEDDWESYSYDDDSFVDLDNDGENEFILYGPYGGIYLDARDGKVYVLSGGEGTAGVIGYAEYEGLTYIYHADTSHAGRQIYLFDRYEEGVIVESFDLSAEYWDNENDQYDEDSDFTFKGEKITMEEYEALRMEILGY